MRAFHYRTALVAPENELLSFGGRSFASKPARVQGEKSWKVEEKNRRGRLRCETRIAMLKNDH